MNLTIRRLHRRFPFLGQRTRLWPQYLELSARWIYTLQGKAAAIRQDIAGERKHLGTLCEYKKIRLQITTGYGNLISENCIYQI